MDTISQIKFNINEALDEYNELLQRRLGDAPQHPLYPLLVSLGERDLLSKLARAVPSGRLDRPSLIEKSIILLDEVFTLIDRFIRNSTFELDEDSSDLTQGDVTREIAILRQASLDAKGSPSPELEGTHQRSDSAKQHSREVAWYISELPGEFSDTISQGHRMLQEIALKLQFATLDLFRNLNYPIHNYRFLLLG